MRINKARTQDLPLILAVYEQARQFMALSGNASQWINGYPRENLLRRDIEAGHLYICLDGKNIAAVFCFRPGPDPTYTQIHNGKWLNKKPYGVIHRLAAARRGCGTASFCIQWCLKQNAHLRIDTHQDNIPMQKTLLKNGFVQCGVIYTEDGTARLAYEHMPLLSFTRQDYPRLLALLLEADPCKKIVDGYFNDCLVFGFCDENGPAACACVLPLCASRCELKNLAVRQDLRAKGVGRALCRAVFAACARRGFTVMTVGTADVPGSPVAFYEMLGFCQTGRSVDFFIRNYPSPVYDGPNLCRDLILLQKRL